MILGKILYKKIQRLKDWKYYTILLKKITYVKQKEEKNNQAINFFHIVYFINKNINSKRNTIKNKNNIKKNSIINVINIQNNNIFKKIKR